MLKKKKSAHRGWSLAVVRFGIAVTITPALMGLMATHSEARVYRDHLTGRSALTAVLGARPHAAVTYIPEEIPYFTGHRVPRHGGRRVGFYVSSMTLSYPHAGLIDVTCEHCRDRVLVRGVHRLASVRGHVLPNDATLIVTVTARGRGGRYVEVIDAGAAVSRIKSLCLAPGTTTHPYRCQPLTVPTKPHDSVRPTIAGSPGVGNELTCLPGTWSGSPPIRFAFSWLRDGQAISGGQESTYVARNTDEGHELSCQVAASNAIGIVSARSESVLIPEEPGLPIITSVDGTRGDLAPYAGHLSTVVQKFTAKSTVVTYVGVVLGNSALPVEASGEPMRVRLCTNAACEGAGAVLATAEAPVANYSLTRVPLGEVAVSRGQSYYVVWSPPAPVDGVSWLAFWHGGGAAANEAREFEAIVRGYDQEALEGAREIISYRGTYAPPAPYSGVAETIEESFVAASNRLTELGVVVGNPSFARGATGPAIEADICASEGCGSGVLATAKAATLNYALTVANLKALIVDPGTRYFVRWRLPAPILGQPWVTYWSGGAPVTGAGGSYQLLVRGHDAEGVTYSPPTVEEQIEGPGVPTFRNYLNAAGEGPAIEAGASVQVSCKVFAPEISSGEPLGYWYRLHSSPWDNEYYAAANAFFNSKTGESLFVDPAVPDC